MGREIVYCASCGTKILDREFESRTAFHIDGRGFCKNCAPEALKSLPPDKMAEILAQISETDSASRRKAAPPPPRRPPTVSLPAVQAQPPETSRTPLVVGSILFAGVLIVLGVAMFSRSEAPPPPPPAPAVQVPKPDREAVALQALRRAREYRDANPKDVATQIASYERLIADVQGTRAAGDARRDLEEIRRRAQEALESELKLLQDQARAASATEEFQKAIQALTDARGRRPEPAWSQGVDRMVSELRALPEKLYPAVKTAAVDARRKGAASGVQEAKDRLATWGMPQYSADLEAALAAVPASDKRPLINGKDMTGWESPRGRWGFKDGMLQTIEVDDQGRTFIYLIEQLGDYELEGMIETTIRTYTEFNVRGQGCQATLHLEPGWHSFRIVAAGADVRVFVDEKPVSVTAARPPRGLFGIFTLGSTVRLKDLKIRT